MLKEFVNILVNFEDLYGMNYCPIFFGFARLLMTLPSALKLLFICLASSNLIPEECVYRTRSEPAKSARTNLPFTCSTLSGLSVALC